MLWTLFLWLALAVPARADEAGHDFAGLMELGERRARVGDCLGTSIGRGFVLTSLHCMTSSTMYVRRFGDAVLPTHAAKVVWQSARSDVGLLRWDDGSRPGIRLGRRGPKSALWVATRLGIIPVELVQARETTADVRLPAGRTLCFGDSGAPLLQRDSGEWQVVGVLSAGMANCTPGSLLRFARTDKLAELGARLGASAHAR